MAKKIVLAIVVLIVVGLLTYVIAMLIVASSVVNFLTNSQKLVVSEISWPESFLTIYSPVNPETKIEIWNYEQYGYQLVFVNGIMAKSQELKTPRTAAALSVHPNQFSGRENINWFIKLYGPANSFKEANNRKVMRFRDEITAVFQNDRLAALAAFKTNQNPAPSSWDNWNLNILNVAQAEMDPYTGYQPAGFWDNVKTWLVNRSFLGRTMNMLSEKITPQDIDRIGNDTINNERVDRLVKIRTDDFPQYAVEAGKEAIFETAGKGLNPTDLPDIGNVAAMVDDVKDFVKNYNSNPPDPRSTTDQIITEAARRAGGERAVEAAKKGKRKSLTYNDLMKLIEDDLKMSQNNNENSNPSLNTNSTNTNSAPKNVAISGSGSWKGGDCRGTIKMDFPSEGGSANGSFNGPCSFKNIKVGSCSGSFKGSYSGGSNGRFSGSTSGSCTINNVTKGGGGSFSGSANLEAGSASGSFSTQGYGGSWRINFNSVK